MRKIVIIGKKNVGKSSLFNLLTSKSEAISIDYSGYTRDCNYAVTKIFSSVYEVIDTPGLGYSSDNLDILTIKKTWHVINSADILLFLIDSFDVYDNLFFNISNMLKKSKKNVIYVLNKIDIIDMDTLSEIKNKFFNVDLFCISLKQKIGIYNLLIKINNIFLNNIQLLIKNKNPFKISIIGKQNVGKSLLSNRLLNDNKSIVYDFPGTTRDNIHTYVVKNNESYLVVDTPGIKKKNKIINKLDKLPIDKALDSIKKSNMCLVVLDIFDVFNKQNMVIIKNVIKLCNFNLILLNKSDKISQQKLLLLEDLFIKKFSFLLNFKYQFISSKYLFGFKELFSRIESIKKLNKFISFDNLIKNVKNKINSNNIVSGKNLIIKKICVKNFNSFNIIVYLNNKKLSDNYKKYLCVLIIKYIDLKNFSFKINFK